MNNTSFFDQIEQQVATGHVTLGDYRVLRVSGSDAIDFLHAQFSSDLRGLAAGSAGLSSYCDLKGRVQALLRVFKADNHIDLILPAALADGIETRLRRYVLRSDVRIDYPQGLQVHGLVGSEAIDGATASGDSQVWSLPTAQSLPVALTVSSQPNEADSITADHWVSAEILAGMPEITAETSGSFLPQMIELEKLGGLSYSKGCYPGQEIVARARRGDVKRHMLLAASQGHALQPGDRIETDGGELAGEVLRSAATENGTTGGVISLVVLRVSVAQSALRVGDAPLTQVSERIHQPSD